MEKITGFEISKHENAKRGDAQRGEATFANVERGERQTQELAT